MDKEKVKNIIKDLLEAIGEDTNSPNIKRTPERVAELYEQILIGKDVDISKVLKVSHSLEHDEMVLIKDIPFYSMCEHDLLPFFGRCHLAYIPEDNRIVGIERLARTVDILSKKLHLQERLTTEIANEVMNCLKPKGVGVVMEARHLCMEMKGFKQPGTKIITSALRGQFRKDIKTREEFLKLIENAS